MSDQFTYTDPVQFQKLVDDIASLPAGIKKAEDAVVEAKNALLRVDLTRKVAYSGHYLKVEGKTVDDKKSQVTILMQKVEGDVLDAQLTLMKAESAYNEKNNEFAALRKVASLLEASLKNRI